MKTYLLDILNKYESYKEDLDVKNILCNKSWLIFNECNNKEVYIFQKDGSLIISFNGKVYKGNWQYITANKSIIISTQERSYMFHPFIFDNIVFVLKQDGTENYAFMINETQCNNFHPYSLSELNNYFKKQEYNDKINQQNDIKNIKELRSEAEFIWATQIDDLLSNDTEYIKAKNIKKKILIFDALFSLIISCFYYIYSNSINLSSYVFILLFSVFYIGAFLYFVKN